MARSIVQKNFDECYLCGNARNLETHHIFGGVANRKLAEKYGLTVRLCHEHHTGQTGVHFDKTFAKVLHMAGQTAFEKNFPALDFRRVFGKSYL